MAWVLAIIAARMKRLWPIFALALVAATPTNDEIRQFRVAQATFEDRLYDVAERQLLEFLAKFPVSEKADNAQYLLAQAQLNQGKWELATPLGRSSAAKCSETRCGPHAGGTSRSAFPLIILCSISAGKSRVARKSWRSPP